MPKGKGYKTMKSVKKSKAKAKSMPKKKKK